MPADNLQWVEVRDFRPGIRHRTGKSSAYSDPLPVGSASDKSYGCYSAPDGSLIPLPKRQSQYFAYPKTYTPGGAENGQFLVNGFHVTGPLSGAAVGSGNQIEYHVGWEWIDSALIRRNYHWERHQVFANPVVVDLLYGVTSGIVNPTRAWRGTFFEDVRMDPSVMTNPGVPLVAAAWYEEGGANTKFVRTYPNPSTPTTNALRDISLTLPCDIIVAHQGRLVMFEQRGWAHGSPGSWISNEQIWYTNINLPTIEPSVAATFATDRMTGIGIAKSVSASEFVIIKFQGGGYAVGGDFSNPTVMRLPGVAPTHGATTIPVYTPAGLVYGQLGGGVYAWGGGDSSILLSPQLEDDFWLHPNAAQWINYHGKFELWKNWIVAPRGWVYDTITQSWWRLQDIGLGSPVPYFHYGVDYGGTLHAVPDRVLTDTPLVDSYSAATPGTLYYWESNFLPNVGAPGRRTRIRELIVEATGTGTIAITATGDQIRTGAAVTFTVGSSRPQVIRKGADTVTTGNVQLKVTVTGTGGNPAPTVHSIRVGYDSGAKVNVA